jgi:hypothetical protein
MLYTSKEVLARIKDHVTRRGGDFATWFVDVTRDARTQLFRTHGVRRKGDHWIYIHAESPAVARKVKSYFTETLGTAGGRESGDRSADFVYAYKKNDHSKP